VDRAHRDLEDVRQQVFSQFPSHPPREEAEQIAGVGAVRLTPVDRVGSVAVFSHGVLSRFGEQLHVIYLPGDRRTVADRSGFALSSAT